MDVTPPSITCPATLNLLCNAPVPAPDITLVTATDACGTPTVTFVSDVANLLVVPRPLQELIVLLMLVVILLYVLKRL